MDHPGLELGRLPLMLGGNVFGWTADRDAGFAVLDRFVELGGRAIDTADIYNNWLAGHEYGESETIIGAWLKDRGTRDAAFVATKVGGTDDKGTQGLAPERIAAACDGSLKRLGVERIDLYFAHLDDPDTPLEAALEGFDALVRAGKVGAIGASNFSAERLKAALAISDANGWARYQVLQPGYNLVNRKGYEGALQALCEAEGIAVVPYAGLASGFLSGKYRDPADLTGERGKRMGKLMEGKGPRVLAAMDAVAAETGASLPAIALAWLAGRPGVAAPIVSATSPAQLDELAAFTALRLTEAQVAALDAAG